jgi:hypothetical protein
LIQRFPAGRLEYTVILIILFNLLESKKQITIPLEASSPYHAGGIQEICVSFDYK